MSGLAAQATGRWPPATLGWRRSQSYQEDKQTQPSCQQGLVVHLWGFLANPRENHWSHPFHRKKEAKQSISKDRGPCFPDLFPRAGVWGPSQGASVHSSCPVPIPPNQEAQDPVSHKVGSAQKGPRVSLPGAAILTTSQETRHGVYMFTCARPWLLPSEAA